MTTLILGGTGKTGRRIAARVPGSRTAARSGADVRFDWDDPATHGPALEGATALYLVPPALRLDHAPLVVAFLDRAQAAGVEHVTVLSARGVELAPPELAHRAIELDVARRANLTHTILRPGWFMQNFSESFFNPALVADGVIAAPSGDTAEAFVHVDDIADVAAETLRHPRAHDKAEYTITGPEALTFAQVAERIGAATGRTIAHVDPPVAEWVAIAVATGIPDNYAAMLGGLLAALNPNPTGDVERVLGRPPRSFADFLADPATLAALTPSAVKSM